MRMRMRIRIRMRMRAIFWVKGQAVGCRARLLVG